MRLRLTFKTTILGLTLVVIILFAFSEIFYGNQEQTDTLTRSRKNERRMASIDGQELDAILRSYSDQKNGDNRSPILNAARRHKFDASKIKQQRIQSSRDRLINGRHKGGYASRTLIEDLELPEAWSLSPSLGKILADRKEHVNKVCRKYGLDKRTNSYQPNSWEYLFNEKYNLAWCPIFKAASSSWMFNFNLLSGYSENFLYSAKDTPVALARQKYNRLKVEDIDEIFNRTSKPLTFMITRHPFERLVSAYRDKIQGGSRYYRKLYMDITKRYPHLADEPSANEIESIKDPLEKAKMRRRNMRLRLPSFRQFVQYLIEAIRKGDTLNEHWTPMNTFCTPCLIDIDVFAKFETLNEDGNYIIFSSGIEHVIKPKKINRSKRGPTDKVVAKYICQLSVTQQEDLAETFKYDLELFQYESKPFFNCSNVLL